MTAERFPFLAHWKVRGLHALPDIPLHELIRKRFAKERRALHDYLARSPFFLLAGDQREALVQLAERDLYQRVVQYCIEALARKIRQGLSERGMALLRAERRARLEGVVTLKIRPPGGGGIMLTPSELVVLKRIHHEMVAAIKEARRANDLPLKANSHDPDRSRDLSLTSQAPWLSELFEDKEIPLLSKGSPSECALRIIAGRLRPSLRYRVSPHTLKKWLKKVPCLK